MNSPDRLTERITEIELLFTHLERQMGDLHAVVLRQEQRIALAEKQLRLLQRTPEEDNRGLPEPPEE